MRRAAAALVLLLLASSAAVAAAADSPPDRAVGLRRAWADPQAVRSVFFVRGMSCRACTMLLDRNLAGTDGIYWARFNYPLRLLVAYHDQRRVSAGQLEEMASAAELRAERLETYPAAGYAPGRHMRVAAWKGGGIGLEEAREIPERFRAGLKANLLEPSDPEYRQVIDEIVGEEVRTRILAERAAAAGYATGPADTVLPAVIARDFYYPADALKPTPQEAGIARFLMEKVLLGDEGEKGRARFDDWLRDLWKDARLDLRVEYLEVDH